LREIAIRTVRPARHIGEPDIHPNHQTLLGAVMRNRLLLLTAAVLLSACADGQNTTAPASRSALASRSSGDVATSSQVSPQAKPTDQVGFTNVFTVVGNGASFDFGNGPTTLTATCPEGSKAIGGSYVIGNWPASKYLVITKFGLNAANGWDVTGWVFDPSAPDINMGITVNCIS
jgi:hypothetical protein